MSDEEFEGFRLEDGFWRAQCPICREWLPELHLTSEDAIAEVDRHRSTVHGAGRDTR